MRPSTGSSFWQCGHHGAHTASTVVDPLYEDHSTRPPVRPGPANLGIRSPAARGCARGPEAMVTPVVEGVPLEPPDPTRTIATTATTTTTAAGIAICSRLRDLTRALARARRSAPGWGLTDGSCRCRVSSLVERAISFHLLMQTPIEGEGSERPPGQVGPRRDQRDLTDQVEPADAVARAAPPKQPQSMASPRAFACARATRNPATSVAAAAPANRKYNPSRRKAPREISTHGSAAATGSTRARGRRRYASTARTTDWWSEAFARPAHRNTTASTRRVARDNQSCIRRPRLSNAAGGANSALSWVIRRP